MSVLVTDTGFQPVPALPASGVADLAHPDDPASLDLAGLTLIRVHVPAFNDGRGFTIGRRLRMLGYAGELRAVGPMIADQYPMARRVGFDAVEIPDEMATRQPEAQWRARANWQAHDYQARLGHARTRA
jgi:uncharacterized protein (DUF934 family)